MIFLILTKIKVEHIIYSAFLKQSNAFDRRKEGI